MKVVRLQRQRPAQCRHGVRVIAGTLEHESERRPRVGELRGKLARPLRMPLGELKRLDVGRGVSARGFEPERAGVGHPHVGAGLIVMPREHALERGPRLLYRRPLERLDRRTPTPQGAIRTKQGIDIDLVSRRVNGLHGRLEHIAASVLVLEITMKTTVVEDAAKPCDDVRNAVVRGRVAAPSDVNELVLRDNLAGTFCQRVQDVELALRERSGRPL